MKRLLLLIVACLPLLFSGTICNVVVGQATTYDLSSDANLQGWWNFENNLNDGSGKGNDLYLYTGTTTYSTNPGVKNGTYCASYNGSSLHNRAGNNLSASFPGKVTPSAITVGGWFRTTGTGSLICPFSYGVGGTANSWGVNITDTNKAQFEIWTTTQTKVTVTGNTTLSSNTDYFIVGTWDGSTIKIYLGTSSTNVAEDDTAGVSCASMYTNNTSSGNLCIGGYIYSGGGWFKLSGNQDDLAVFNRVLSLSEMISWQNHGLNNSH